MGISFAKSVKMGAVRFNFSGSGIGVSIGIPGLRIGSGPSGAYISGGMAGFRYRKSLGSSSAIASTRPRLQLTEAPRGAGRAPDGTSAPTGEENIEATLTHDTKNVLELQDSTHDDLLRSINEQRRKVDHWPFFAGAGFLLVLLVGNQRPDWPIWAFGSLVGSACVATAWAYWRDRIRKVTVLFFQPDANAQQMFGAIVGAVQSCGHICKLKSVASTSRYRDARYSAGAAQGVSFAEASMWLGQAPGIVANVDVPILKAGKTSLAFYPDRILAFQGKAVGAIEYKNLIIESVSTRFIEHETIPPDAEVIDRTWQYVNKKGGPDRRFKNNKELPICRYNELNLSTGDGLDIKFLGSRPGAFDGIAAAVAAAGQRTG